MGSLRNPIGPLPSSIYWRRRVVLLSVIALLAVIALWIVLSSAGDGKNGAGGGDAKHPTASITPGPSESGPAISQAPGGRDDSGAGTGSSSGSGSDSGDASGSSGSSGSGDTSSAGGTGTGTGSGSAAVEVGSEDALPGGSPLPNCVSNAVQLSLRSAHNTYEPGEQPSLLLTAKNTSGSDCKIDLGPKNAIVTISKSGESSDYWSSADCPPGASTMLFKVPANTTITYTVKWDLKPSAPECATPPAGTAAPGTYLAEANSSGFPKAQTSFVIKTD
ncbi:hypothetical protein ACIQOU_07415 [Streptomyces sp. NPDC091279]|uniref:hypothetical protein n=1 Tax=unclassified Streptomyces TaxID=2593676 RepID=UPI0038081714